MTLSLSGMVFSIMSLASSTIGISKCFSATLKAYEKQNNVLLKPLQIHKLSDCIRDVSLCAVRIWHGSSIGGRRSGLMVKHVGLRIKRSWPGHCVVFLSKTLYSHSTSLHPRSINGYRQTVRETLQNAGE